MSPAIKPPFFKKNQPTAENFKCQKCLEIGHFTYECTGKRKYTYRPSRTKEMVKRMKKDEEDKQLETLAKASSVLEKIRKTNKKKRGRKRRIDHSLLPHHHRLAVTQAPQTVPIQNLHRQHHRQKVGHHHHHHHRQILQTLHQKVNLKGHRLLPQTVKRRRRNLRKGRKNRRRRRIDKVLLDLNDNWSLHIRKPIIVFSDQVRPKPACSTVTDDG